MRGSTFAGGSVPHLGCNVTELWGLSLDCLWQLATTQVGLAVLGFVAILVVRYVRSPWRHVPPGPRGLPIIGNALEMRDKSWLLRRDCKEKYKDLLYMNALGQPILIFNSLKPAAELLDRRASIYSSRPRLIMAHEVLSGGFFTAFLPYGDLWRRTRRASHEVLTKSAVRHYHSLLCKEALLLASSLLASPEAREKHFQRAAASATMSIVYDYPTLETESDETIEEIHAFGCRTSVAATPGTYLVELFPWMLHIPERFARWKYEGRRYFKQHNAMFERLFNRVRSDMLKGNERPSLSATLIQNSDRNQLSNQEMAWLAGTLYAAGADTSSTTMQWWALAMIAHPEVQRRAQAELDTVVGRSRTPTFSDAPGLPYIQAIVKEVLRWRPVLALALPHTSTEDDWYEGMFIPKGTMCLTNLWHCHHDPSAYGDDAAAFRPERFLDARGEMILGPAETREEGHCTYGFGRRACVGKHVANELLFIFVATTLWAATLERVRGKDGKEVPLDTDTFVDSGMVYKPAPYECKITPRFSEALSILAAEEELLGT